jgi:hypothetical protein
MEKLCVFCVFFFCEGETGLFGYYLDKALTLSNKSNELYKYIQH